MDTSRNMVKLYNNLQERYNMLKHDSNAHIANVKGYELVDMADNYYKMRALEEVMTIIEKQLEEA